MMHSTTRSAWLAGLCIVGLLTGGCATFSPHPSSRQELLARAVTDELDGVKVSAVVLGAEESRRHFGVDLAGRGIQPVWLEIRNGNDYPVWYPAVSTDPSYFAPREVAYRFHSTFGGDANVQLSEYFGARGLPSHVPARGTASGFVFTHLDAGAKCVNAKAIGNGKLTLFRFVVPVPGGAWDYEKVDLAHLYKPERIVALDLEGLRGTLEAFPCCTANREGTKLGDPLNLVIVGDRAMLLSAFVGAGWSLTESLTAETAAESAEAFFFRHTDLYSPLSPLYVFGRHQDVALQKARATISHRNHLRLWLSPYTFEGRHVWVGQISRDIGVRLTMKSWYLTTHKIEPDVDEDRGYLLQSLATAQGVSRFGFLGGVGAAPPSAPRANLTGDPYYTDGLRLILFLADRPTAIEGAEFLGWEVPPAAP